MAAEIKGIAHPDMTPEMARDILPDGCAAVPLDLMFRVGRLLNPLTFADTRARDIISVLDELNAAVDSSLRKAQEAKQRVESPS